MNKFVVKRILSFINLPRMIPHVLLFLFGLGGGNLRLDINRAAIHHRLNGGTLKNLLFLLTFDKTFRNLFYYRIGKWSAFIKWLLPPHNSFVIGVSTIIKGPFLGVHPIGTTINAKSIDSGFICRNNTVIGCGKGGLPTIGSNVDVGTNCVIIGGIVVGNNVKIGAGCVCTKSIPDNCTVVGNPAYIIRENEVRTIKKL